MNKQARSVSHKTGQAGQTSSNEKFRLDDLLVARHGYPTRSRARDAIKRGCVFSGVRTLSKPGQMLGADTALEIHDEGIKYVSRAALKLQKGLETLGAIDREFDLAGKIALDLGASTGGFTQLLLEHNISQVFAVDVGHNQLHEKLSNDPRVVNLEGLNARELSSEYLQQLAPEFIVCDISFISLKLALPRALQLAAEKCWGIFLIKPQFEVGRKNIGRGGLIRDEEIAAKCVKDLTGWFNEQSPWQVLDVLPSPISGADGNREFLLLARNFRDA